MYLKSMTARGFKSFASSTTLQFEPGITCVVGPNGSGKSNVVDAIAWVMGEQGAKSLRGGKMEDVIFAGTTGRAPLGRAEVVLTIDNTDGALPVDYTEVTLSRIMFRNGGSEYSINGQTCRLLDIQELLSDSGIGREMHVIVGQGQLDAVLAAGVDERRGFIEEAAGVLKHRKRKEKALRKLEATEDNQSRLQDLLTEIRRQLKPLGRQAEVARKAAEIQAEVRDARLRLLADELCELRSTLEREVADEEAMKHQRDQAEAGLAKAQQAEAELDEALRADAPRVAAAQDTWYQLSSLAERLRGTAGLAEERLRHLAHEPEEERVAQDPDQLEAESARVRGEESEIAAAVEQHQATLDEAVRHRQECERTHSEEEGRIAALQRAAADRREGLAKLSGQVNAARSRVEARENEIERMTAARADARGRAETAERDFTALETRVAGLDAGEEGLDAEYAGAQEELTGCEERLTALSEQERTAERERAALAARKEALELGLDHKDGAAALLAATEPVSGLLGAVSGLLTVEAGYEAAVAAALGRIADAVAVESLDAATVTLDRLRAEDLGRAGMLLGGAEGAAPSGVVPDRAAWPALPSHAVYAVDVVSAPPELRRGLVGVLDRTVVVEDVAAARELIGAHPELVAVTREGDLLASTVAHGGSAAKPSVLEVRAAVDDATARLEEATHQAERLRFERSTCAEEREKAAARVEAALERLHESDAQLSAVAEQLGDLGSAGRSARAEAERMERGIEEARAAVEQDQATLSELDGRLVAARDTPEEDPSTGERDRLAEGVRLARQAEMEARLALRTSEERGRALAGRAESLQRAAEEERAARVRAQARRERQVREARVAESVGGATRQVLTRLDRSLEAAGQERDVAQQARAAREAEVAQVRRRVRDLSAELERLTGSAHRDEMARQQQRLRVEALEQRAVDELGIEPDVLVAEYGPDQPIPSAAPAEGGQPGGEEQSAEEEGRPFVRSEQEKRLRSAERKLSQLGKVNPLALEEYAALEERHQFLTEQLDDVKKTRKDLMDIIHEVDERVEQVFSSAFEDTARAFADVFSRLFPGGEGRLVLTDPSDLLTTGVEVEARPPGKKVKRLSLLSGGERSLVAATFLVALFKARPSPFYILDEVEAALDDVNLGRLLEIYEELRAASQLLVITHQKRTMEIADALYGVSMRGDGVSTVISQRLREAEAATG